MQAEYHFQRDEENQAYRLIGVATRLCLEKGLHDSANLLMQYPDDTQRAWIVKLFWSIYVLDRRWSLGMGRPFALQDRDIDASLPKPVNISSILPFTIANAYRMTTIPT